MKQLICILFSLLLFFNSFCQDRYFTKTGHVWFVSKTAIIDIDADNNEVAGFIDIKTGRMVFALVNRDFEFKYALAEEHFNENYIESHKYPKSKFSGKILNIDETNLASEGTYKVEVEGELTIHGVTNKINVIGIMKVEEGKISAVSEFNILLSDYKIKIPRLVEDKVSNVINIRVDMIYEPYEK